ncbi:hypothetical protein ONA70_33400 [Micromonospora yasonensis]|uniref:hypothetical protein n=1 Tax=Micromonospora yasonensis TaxID=1128667 RepID=UPI002230D1EC|nr:hypothetical protein [Micromonospora yasonensis]MCW3844976.1 hypothetical protein [Micromonospora yasonensis]
MSLHRYGVPRTYPAVPIAFLLPCAVMAIVGFLPAGEPAPPAPAGVLAPAQVLQVQRDGAGRATGVLLRVESTEGPVICGIARTDFPDGQLPARHERITVDYTPSGCAAPPSAPEQVPGWALATGGSLGLALMIFWLWAGSDRATRPRYRRTGQRGRVLGVRAPGTGIAAAGDAPATRRRRPVRRPRGPRRRP